MIEIQNLNFRYPDSEFQLVLESLEIKEGSSTAIVGPSGSGKTTLLNLIAGISVPHSGTVDVDSTSVSSLTDAERRDFRISRIGLVFQRFELIEYLDVRTNILLPFLINQSLELNNEVRQNADELAKAMGMSEKLQRQSTKLSQGEQQRVAICRALVTKPKIILADEPTGNLDPKNKRIILDLLFEQANSNQQTLVVVTHDHSLINDFDQVFDFEKFLASVAPPSQSEVPS